MGVALVATSVHMECGALVRVRCGSTTITTRWVGRLAATSVGSNTGSASTLGLKEHTVAEEQWIHVRQDGQEPIVYMCNAMRDVNDGGTISLEHFIENPSGHIDRLRLCGRCQTLARREERKP
jgi:hypothetical protein